MFRQTEPESIDYLLAQICRLHHARAHALLEEIGLYRGQPPVLRALWEEEGRTHSELAARLCGTQGGPGGSTRFPRLPDRGRTRDSGGCATGVAYTRRRNL